MRYLVFLENKLTLKEDGSPKAWDQTLIDCGLEDHGGAIVGNAPEAESPSGTAGKMLAWQCPESPDMCYSAKKQTWYHNKKFGYWVGVWNDSPPTEKDLRRVKTQRGKFLKLGQEGQRSLWKIPTAGLIESKVHFNDDGEMVNLPVKRYSGFVDDAQKILDESVANGGLFLWTKQEVSSLVHKAFRINYMILGEVINHLDLLTSTHVTSIMETVLGVQFKKDDEPEEG